jgi:hypothetical protein
VAQRHGDGREYHWLKAHALAGTKTRIVAAVIVTDKNAGDYPQFEPLIRHAVELGFPLKEVYADRLVCYS